MTKEPKNKKLDVGLIRRILSYTGKYKALFFSALFLTLMLSALAVVRPLLISESLNEYVVKHKDINGLTRICLFIFGFLIIEAICQIINMRITSLLGQNIVKDLRNQVYKHILHLRNTYFDNSPVGTLVTRAVSDIESLNDVFSQGFIVIAGDLVMLTTFITVMLFKY